MEDLEQVEVTLMELLVFEVGPGKPVAADVAVDFDLRALVFDVSFKPFESLYFLCTGKTIDLKSEALILDVLLQVLKVHALLHLAWVAAVQDFDLPDHLTQ